MYTVFLADDEFKVINGLLRTIDWEGLQSEVIGYAQDGLEAEEKISSLQPDIVFIDICMPQKSGLEVMESIFEDYPCAFIIFSGYTEFEYAKKALQMKAVDYLIKPVNVSEIEDSIRKAQKHVDQRRLSGNPEKTEKQNWLLTVLDGGKPIEKFYSETKGFFLFVIRFQCGCTAEQESEITSELNQFKSSGCEFIVLKKRNERIFFGASSTDINAKAGYQAFIRYLKGKEKRYPAAFYWGKGAIVPETAQIGNSYIEAVDMVELCEFFCAQQTEETVIKENNFNKKGMIDSITKQIMCADSRGDAGNIISDFFQQAIDSGYTSNRMRGLSLELYYSLKYQYQKEYQEVLMDAELQDDYFDHFMDLTNLETIKQKIMSFYDGINRQLQTQNSFYQQRVINSCKAYVQEHIEEPITLGDVALFVNMNPTYLSHNFKKATGITLFDYISDQRIAMAKQLLKNTYLKIFEIAKRVGYPDQRYFCQVFKKKTGMTAAEYRNQK